VNRNTLLIALVAIAVIGVAVGLVLPGALQNGSLSGTITKTLTKVTLTATTTGESGTGNHLVRLQGKLSTLDGTGIAGAPVELSQQISTTTFLLGTVTTGADGAFSSTCEEPPNSSNTSFVYFAVFRGTSWYDPSQSDNVHRT